MLRSLVGSEMCIRDRTLTTNGSQLTRYAAELAAHGVRRINVSVDTLDPCLLYTSDAADDLLCVDLGGRRILKKKNHDHALTH